MHHGLANWTQQELTYLFQWERSNFHIGNNPSCRRQTGGSHIVVSFCVALKKKVSLSTVLLEQMQMLSTPTKHDFWKGYASPIQAKLIMIKSRKLGRGSWKFTGTIFLILLRSSSMKPHWEGMDTHNFSCFWLTSFSQFWITAHEGFYDGSSIAYLCWYDQFHCLFEYCTGIEGLVLYLSQNKHGHSWKTGWAE